jgi:hypothetical protein
MKAYEKYKPSRKVWAGIRLKASIMADCYRESALQLYSFKDGEETTASVAELTNNETTKK